MRLRVLLQILSFSDSPSAIYIAHDTHSAFLTFNLCRKYWDLILVSRARHA